MDEAELLLSVGWGCCYLTDLVHSEHFDDNNSPTDPFEGSGRPKKSRSNRFHG